MMIFKLMTDILSKWCGTFDWTPKNPPFISMIEMQSYKVVTFMRMNKYWLKCDTYIQLITFIVFNLKEGRKKFHATEIESFYIIKIPQKEKKIIKPEGNILSFKHSKKVSLDMPLQTVDTPQYIDLQVNTCISRPQLNFSTCEC